jgi:hypothetical protein
VPGQATAFQEGWLLPGKNLGYAPGLVQDAPLGLSFHQQLLERARATWPDLLLVVFAVLQLWPFTTAFHQTADDNFWQFAVLSTIGHPELLAREIQKIAETQGRVGMYPGMLLVLLGAVLPEYAWGRVAVVALFGMTLLAFCRLLARSFGMPLTRAGLLGTLCCTPMVAHHMPPNAFPLLITVPLLLLLLLHIRLARGWQWRQAWIVGPALVGLTLLLEYAFVAGVALAGLAVARARPGERGRALLLHGATLLASAGIYLAYRTAFPSQYPGNALSPLPAAELLWLQARHAFGGTIFPHLPLMAMGRLDLLLAATVLVAGAGLSAHLLPALARRLHPAGAAAIALACLGWAWLNTLPHALTPKYQSWCRAGDCAYVDSRVAALGAGVLAVLGLAMLLRLVLCVGRGRVAWLATASCAVLLGGLGATTFLHNRAAARVMAEHERAFLLLREASCRSGTDLSQDEGMLLALGQTIRWHLPPAQVPPPEVYLAAYRDGLRRLGVRCQTLWPAPAAWPVEFLGWATPEPQGRWSIGRTSVLRLAASPGTGGTALFLAAYVPPGQGPQRVIARTHRWRCEFLVGSTPREIVVPAPDGPAPEVTTLVLDMPDAVSPAAAGQSIDQRVLGVFLSAAKPLPPGNPPAEALDLRRCAGPAP